MPKKALKIITPEALTYMRQFTQVNPSKDEQNCAEAKRNLRDQLVGTAYCPDCGIIGDIAAEYPKDLGEAEFDCWVCGKRVARVIDCL